MKRLNDFGKLFLFSNLLNVLLFTVFGFLSANQIELKNISEMPIRYLLILCIVIFFINFIYLFYKYFFDKLYKEVNVGFSIILMAVLCIHNMFVVFKF